MSRRNHAHRGSRESVQPPPQSVGPDTWNTAEFRRSVLIDLAFVTLPAVVMSAFGEHRIAAIWFCVGVLVVIYQFWDQVRSFWRSLRSEPRPVEPTTTQRAVPGRGGSMTAHQAWAVVAPDARALDARARLTLITSGLDMNPQGRSRTWEFIFFLPTRHAKAMLSLEPDPESSDVDNAQSVLTQRIKPASEHDAQWPPFPDHFRDSPEVVAEFVAGGVDFVAGPTDMKLEGRVLPSGAAVWVTYYWDQERTATF